MGFDFTQECVDLISAFSKVHKLGLSVCVDKNHILLPNLKKEKLEINLSYKTEALISLYSLNEQEMFFNYFLACYMLMADNYEYCDELIQLIDKAEFGREKPFAVDLEILTKLFFISLHEIGHYVVNTDRGENILYHLVCETFIEVITKNTQKEGIDIDGFFSSLSKEVDDDKSVDIINNATKVMKSLDCDFDEKFIEEADFTKDHERKREECAADMYAISNIFKIFRTAEIIKDEESAILVCENIIRGLYFTHIVNFYNMVLNLDDDEKNSSIMVSTTSLFNTLRIQVARMTIPMMLEDVFGYNYVEKDNLMIELSKQFLHVVNALNAPQFKKYIEYMGKGEFEEYDEMEYRRINDKLIALSSKIREAVFA